MSLIDQLRADYLTARKNRLPNVTAALSTLIGELEGKAEGIEKVISDELALSTVKKFIKNQAVVLEHATGDAAQAATAEIVLLSEYLPKQLTEEKLRDLAKAYWGASIGTFMSLLKTEFPNRYDSKLAAQIHKEVNTI